MLDQLLVEHSQLWQPHPFKVERPAWCQNHPTLSCALLKLDEAALSHYASDSDALISFVAGFIPQLKEIPSLVTLPATGVRQGCEIPSHLSAGVPGRKWQQITSLYHAIENPLRPVTEWCGGKGYLGRVLSSQWQQPVTTLEYNPRLVAAGTALTQKYRLNQQFKTVDVLNNPVGAYLNNQHPIALHACGDLHRALIRQIIKTHAPGFTIVPCCYHLGRDKHYRPFNSELKLHLSREMLRLAVNETVTAHHNEINKRNLDMAWKLGFQQLRASVTGNADYHAFMPVPKAWLTDGFQAYCRKLCQRENIILPDAIDWHQWEETGYQRQHDVMRLQLLRSCFKRVLEMWLIMDMAVYLEDHGYQVNVAVFCERAVTPRNIMIEGFRTFHHICGR